MQTTATNDSGHVAGGKTEADTSAHTATPWHSTSSEMGVHVHHYVEARIRPGVIQEIAYCGPTEGAEGSRGNAEFIVRACNAHADLLKALQAFVDTAGITDRETGETREQEDSQLFADARAALRKAGA